MSRLPDALLTRAEALPEATRRRIRRALVIALAAALVVTAVLGILVYRAAADRDRAQSALDAARSDTEQLLTVNVLTVDADLARATGVTAEPFTTQFRRTATETIAPATRERQLLVRAKVVNAGLLSLDGDRAEVLVHLDQSAISGTQPGPPELNLSQVREVLVRAGDRWLISEFQPL